MLGKEEKKKDKQEVLLVIDLHQVFRVFFFRPILFSLVLPLLLSIPWRNKQQQKQ
jgi:hypothetical protein